MVVLGRQETAGVCINSLTRMVATSCLLLALRKD
jgi:hypothetical protein